MASRTAQCTEAARSNGGSPDAATHYTLIISLLYSKKFFTGYLIDHLQVTYTIGLWASEFKFYVNFRKSCYNDFPRSILKMKMKNNFM